MSKGLLLLVDDTVNNLKVLSDCLTTNGYEVRCATSGELALQALEYILPELILLDIRMPGIDGYETCKRILANPKRKDIPIIFISAMQETDERVHAFEVGGVDFVTKPFHEKEVLARVGAHVNLHRARKQLQGLLQTTSDEYSAFQRRVEILFGLMSESVGIFQETEDGTYILVECNPAFENMVGSPKSILLRKKGSEIFQNNRTSFMKELATQLPTQPDLELPLQSFGFRKYYRTSATILAPKMLALVSTDVSDLVRSQEDLEVRTNELESVVHVLSHDLRSPLVNIQGFQHELQDELIASCKGKDESHVSSMLSSLKMIASNTKKLESLIRGLSTIARTGRRQFNKESVNVGELLHNLIDINRELWNMHGNFDIRFDSLPACIGDKIQLCIVFENIIGNSIQYKHSQRPTLIEITSEVKDGHVVYCIKDNGRGIALHHQGRVWDLFYRGDSVDQLGEGIGLSVVRKIMDRLQGRTWLTSELDVGTQLFLELKSAG